MELATRQLAILSTVDELTGLKNRRYFEQSFPEIWQACKNEHQSISAIILDLDKFKRLNDTLGHQEGDHCLKEVATTLLQSQYAKRDGDIVARLGGDEFIIILARTAHKDALNIAECLRSRVESLQIPTGRPELYITVSIGVTTDVEYDELQTHHDLITQTDKCLYKAKVH